MKLLSRKDPAATALATAREEENAAKGQIAEREQAAQDAKSALERARVLRAQSLEASDTEIDQQDAALARALTLHERALERLRIAQERLEEKSAIHQRLKAEAAHDEAQRLLKEACASHIRLYAEAARTLLALFVAAAKADRQLASVAPDLRLATDSEARKRPWLNEQIVSSETMTLWDVPGLFPQPDERQIRHDGEGRSFRSINWSGGTLDEQITRRRFEKTTFKRSVHPVNYVAPLWEEIALPGIAESHGPIWNPQTFLNPDDLQREAEAAIERLDEQLMDLTDRTDHRRVEVRYDRISE